MNFRVALRDRRGGVADAEKLVTIVGGDGVGPFQITTQNSSPTMWQTGTAPIVTWDVAGTDANGIDTGFVNILLSIDGGQTFPITLAANTPNDGKQSITVPNNPTMMARIKVEAIGNIFFDINNANFVVSAPTAAEVTVSGRVIIPQNLGLTNAIVTLTDSNGIARTTVTGKFGNFTFREVAAGETYVLTVSTRRYTFAPQIISPTENLSGITFLPQ